MADKNEIVLTEEQAARMIEAQDIIAGAIEAHCSCSAAILAPERIGLSFGRGRINELETVSGIANRFALCEGVANNMCRYPPAPEERILTLWTARLRRIAKTLGTFVRRGRLESHI